MAGSKGKAYTMGIKRRDFLKVAGAVSATLLSGAVQANPDECAQFDDAFGVLVDTTVCIGCRKCEAACNEKNRLSDQSDFSDKSVFNKHRRPSLEAYTVVNSFPNEKGTGGQSFLKVQCMHCNDPACASACIVGALTKCQHGPVAYDADRCIGCRYCMVACPYQIPAYEYNKAIEPRVMKCDFCTDRVHNHQPPACVESCPAEAMTFGRRNDLIDLARLKIKKDPDLYTDHIFGENEVGGSSWMYLASADFSATELPALPTDPVPPLTETIQHGIFKYFIPPVALYGFLGLVMHSLRDDDDDDEGDRHAAQS